jgi:coproporphyrinogen III oxidase-like Fe-S oxidoreductase
VVGLGAAALTHVWGRARWQNRTDPAAYAAAVLSGRSSAFRGVEICRKDELTHWALNRLLRPLPVSRTQVAVRFGKKLLPFFEKKMRTLHGAGALSEIKPGVFSARPGRWFEVTSGLYGAKYLAAIAMRFGIKEGAG